MLAGTEGKNLFPNLRWVLMAVVIDKTHFFSIKMHTTPHVSYTLSYSRSKKPNIHIVGLKSCEWAGVWWQTEKYVKNLFYFLFCPVSVAHEAGRSSPCDSLRPGWFYFLHMLLWVFLYPHLSRNSLEKFISLCLLTVF